MESRQGPQRRLDAETEPGLVAPGGPSAGARPPTLRSLVIVARGEPDLRLYLMQTDGGIHGFQAIFDRRQRERRHQVQPYTPERRQADRRRPLTGENTLRRQPFLVVPHEQGVGA